MDRYVETGERCKPSGDFFKRYVAAHKAKSDAIEVNEKAEFTSGYKKGSMRYAIASKYMNLKFAGMDSYIQDDNGLCVIWQRNGDQIVRVDSDTTWIDEMLKAEGI